MKFSIILILIITNSILCSKLLRNTSESSSKALRGKTYLQLTSMSNMKRKTVEEKYLYHKESVLDLEVFNNPKVEDDKLGLVFEIKEYGDILNQIMIKYSDKSKKDHYYMPFRFIEECDCKSIEKKLFIQCFLLNDNLEQYTWRLSLPLTNSDVCPEQSMNIVNQINTKSKLIKNEIIKNLTDLKNKINEVANKKKVILESEQSEYDRIKSYNEIKKKNEELNKKKSELSKKMEESSTQLLEIQNKLSELEKVKNANDFNIKVSKDDIIELNKSLELLKLNDIKKMSVKYSNEIQGDITASKNLFEILKKKIPYKKDSIDKAQKGLEEKNITPVNDFLYSVLERINSKK